MDGIPTTKECIQYECRGLLWKAYYVRQIHVRIFLRLTENKRENVNRCAFFFTFVFAIIRGDVIVFINIPPVTCPYSSIFLARLNHLHNKYYMQGLRILAFPCGEFGCEVRLYNTL